MLALRCALRSIPARRGSTPPCQHRSFWPFRSGRVSDGTENPPRLEPKLTETCLQGRRWHDSFRYLEHDESALQQYLQAEKRYAEKQMQPLAALQRQLHTEMAQNLPDDQGSLPAPMGEWRYMTQAAKDAGGVRFIRTNAAGHEQIVLDLTGPQHSHLALGQMKVSRSQHLVAYTLETSPGSEQYTAYIQEIATGDVIDSIPGADSIEFLADNASVAYTMSNATGRPNQVMLRKIGGKSSSEKCLKQEAEQDTHLHVGRTKDWKYLVLNSNSKSTSEVTVLDAHDPWHAKPILVQAREPDVQYFLEHHGGRFYIMTNALDGGEMCIAVAEPSELPKRMADMQRCFVPEPGKHMEDMDMFQTALVLYMRVKGNPCIRLFSWPRGDQEGSSLQEGSCVDLPEGYTELAPGPNPDYFASHIYMEASSPVAPPVQLKLDLTDPTYLEPLQPGDQPGLVEQSPYICKQMAATSSGGVEVPMTLAYKQAGDWPRPLLLTSYGAYGMCAHTSFKPERITLLDRGWVVATAHIRGGGELGREWHCSATGKHKVVSVTDLEACMDCLVREGYTEHGMIALEGHSAGALPMAALINRRPASIAAAVLHAPLVDYLSAMTDQACPLRLHEVGEFGDPCTDAEVLDAMLELCPYLNLKPGNLPAVLLRIGLDDVRVPPWGPAKYAAKLQACQQGSAPVLLLARPGGHFADERDAFQGASADYAFLLHVMASRCASPKHRETFI